MALVGPRGWGKGHGTGDTFALHFIMHTDHIDITGVTMAGDVRIGNQFGKANDFFIYQGNELNDALAMGQVVGGYSPGQQRGDALYPESRWG